MKFLLLLLSLNAFSDSIEEILCNDSGNTIEVTYGVGDEIILTFEESKLLTRLKHVRGSILDLAGDDKIEDIKILSSSLLFIFDKDKLECKKIGI